MMSFCKRSVHSLLSLASPINVLHSSSSSTTSGDHKPSCKCLPDQGLGLVSATGLTRRTPNVLESTTMKSSPSSSPDSSCKKDPVGIGFLDDIGGGVDGLMSCTESLGFESSDERRVDDEIESMSSTSSSSSSTSAAFKWRKLDERRRDRDKVKNFPPPISSLNHNGLPNFFLRPVRRDGRLELTEIRIDRPEILRAFREDGRLRLHLVTHEEGEEAEEDDDDDEEEIYIDEEEQYLEQEVVEKEEDNENENIQEEEEEDGKGEEKAGEWNFSVTGEGFLRCHDHHNQHHSNHHHNLHVWRQHCVTTR